MNKLETDALKWNHFFKASVLFLWLHLPSSISVLIYAEARKYGDCYCKKRKLKRCHIGNLYKKTINHPLKSE